MKSIFKHFISFFACLIITSQVLIQAQNNPADQTKNKTMMFSDTSRRGTPTAKDPHVIYFNNRYLMYYSVPPFSDEATNPVKGWGIGIAQSDNLIDWQKIGEVTPSQQCDSKGLCAPCARVIKGKVHLFYQTYGNGKDDAICHAVSKDGIHFEKDSSNPIFHPTGKWNCGRAIDAEVFQFNDQYFLYYATRDPEFKIQLQGVASAKKNTNFSRKEWKDLSVDKPILKPELPWEGECIEAASIIERNGKLYMFYAGAYNNWPQQIGVAVSTNGVDWERLSDKPFLANGPAGTWNNSESGHPHIFEAPDGRTFLFFQGNNDKGKTWYLSNVEVFWNEKGPYLKPVPQPKKVALGDPFIMLYQDTYYAYGTEAADGITVYTSNDLISWKKMDQLALHKEDTWANRWFWAPEVYVVNGKFYMYFSANEHIAVAVSDSPLGPFKQTEKKPMLEGEKCIDNSLFIDDDGKPYLFFDRFNDGLNIWSAELEKDLIHIKTNTLKKCIHVSQPWEEEWPRVNEGAFITKHNGVYYLTYSGNSYECQCYGIGYATATSINGPWTKYEKNPIFQKVGGLVGIGHSAMFKDKDGNLRIVFHAHNNQTKIHPRHMYIGTVRFVQKDGKEVMEIDPDYLTPVLE